ncbi:MAG: chemotaxis protein CheW [Smithellaceae bacterium]|jgi:chemotaxis-related protein WspB|nr:purine-binding chemotaxis protein CheW [Syntrophaceae bacterium]MDD4241467.1 chemotaxis protein CheW [Smithellaceae bacterium]NLX52729.1 purine-binding chemotaxis protein CheW [Deltaproteobacteria bacterium]
MLILQFQAGRERYGLDIEQILEISSLVSLRPIPHAPPEVAGTFNYRGTLTPVVDLTALLTGVASRPRMSTRIILVAFQGEDGRSHILGLVAEEVTEMISCRRESLQQPVVSVGGASYLGDMVFDERGSIQLLDLERLLTRDLLFTLFPPEVSKG